MGRQLEQERVKLALDRIEKVGVMERNEQWKGLGLVPVKSPSIVQKQESHKMFYLVPVK